MKGVVLVITDVGDFHADAVIAELSSRGVPAFRLHTDEFPGSVRISLRVADGTVEGTIAKPGLSVSIDEIGAAWYRRPRTPVPASGTDPAASRYAVRQSAELLRGLYATLDVHWVCDPFTVARAEVKALQLMRAHAAGLAVPRTVLGNSAADCEAFRRELLPASMAVKTFDVITVDRDDGSRWQPVTAVLHPDEPLDGVELAPSIFQPYVPKAFELRCVVVGERIFAAKLLSQERSETSIDWRVDECRLEPYALPEDVALRLRALVASFELNFASVDFIVTPEGEHVFLDLNPNGQWLWLERELGLPLSEALADLLCSRLDRSALAA